MRLSLQFDDASSNSDYCAVAEERSRQLRTTLDRLQAGANEGAAVIFGGDTNLREAEANAEKRLQQKSGSGVGDGWVLAGADTGTRFTWDLELNDNKQFGGGEFKPRARYDRIFLGPCAGRTAKATVVTSVERFDLLGMQRMAEGCFPSDHFGMDVTVVLCIGATENSRDATSAAESTHSLPVDLTVGDISSTRSHGDASGGRGGKSEAASARADTAGGGGGGGGVGGKNAQQDFHRSEIARLSEKRKLKEVGAEVGEASGADGGGGAAKADEAAREAMRTKRLARFEGR